MGQTHNSIEERKSNDSYEFRLHPQHSGYIWTNLDKELSFILTTNLKSPIVQQISSFRKTIHDVCFEWFDQVMEKRDQKKGKTM